MTEAEFIKQTDFVIDRLYARTVRKGLSFSKRDAGELVTEAQNVMVSFLLDEMSEVLRGNIAIIEKELKKVTANMDKEIKEIKEELL